MCLTSALVYHDLADAFPFGTDIALTRGTLHHPAGFAHVTWHSLDAATSSVGREVLEIGEGVEMAIDSAERTIIDCFRLMHREGSDVAYKACAAGCAAGGVLRQRSFRSLLPSR